ncbi:MAG: ABC transporter ATP-binding protein [Clostridiales bacterium]|nr:ABC transporter ATP-binding protein [Clostridiales bacterium]
MTFNELTCFIKNRFKSYIFLTCLKELFRTFLNILFPILLSKVISNATDGNVNEVLTFAIVIVSIKLIEFVVLCISDIGLQRNVAKNKHLCKIEFYKYFFDKPLYELAELKVGDTKEKLNDDFETITAKYTSTYPRTITSIISAVAYFVYLFTLNKWIALIFFSISLIQVVPPILIRKYLQVNYDECRDIEGQITDFIVGGYRAFLMIKLYRLNDWWNKKLAEYHKKYAKIGRKSIYTGTTESVLNDIVNNILTYVTYGIIGLLVLKNITTLDVGIQSIAVSGSVFALVKNIFDIIKDISLIKTAQIRIADKHTYSETQEIHISKGNISISNLTFSYDGNDLIHDLSLTVNTPKISSIKGENGSGKTTLLNLISGVIKSNEGKISIDGHSPLHLSCTNYPNELFFLPQEDAVFNFSAVELFNMVLPNRTEDALALSKNFGLSEDLLYNSTINKLSGGERKKVFLCVAFIIDPVLIILDEPTNSLDVHGKALLKELLKKRFGRTLIVTHDDFIDDITEQSYGIRRGEKYEQI